MEFLGQNKTQNDLLLKTDFQFEDNKIDTEGDIMHSKQKNRTLKTIKEEC